MEQKTSDRRKGISEFLSIIIKWKNFLIINLVVILAISAIILLLTKNEYKSSATVIISSSSENGIQLSGMLSDVSSLLGGGNMQSGEVEYLLGILGSRKLKLQLIKNFDLINYYDITKYKIDNAIKKLEKDYFFELNDNGMIDISFIHKNPKISAKIIKFVIHFADSTNIFIHHQKAKNYREFLEKRYQKALSDLSNFQSDLQKFQKKTKLYVIPEQLLVGIKGIAEVEKQIYAKELQLEILRSKINPNTSAVNQLQKEIKILKNNLMSLQSGKSKFSGSIAFIPTEKIPVMYSQYMKIYRKLEVQKKILEVLTPMYEQALMDEQKQMPTLIVLDPPYIPELKYFPKRASIMIIVFLLSLFFVIPIILFGEYSITNNPENLFERKSQQFYLFLKKIYFLNF